MDLQLLGKRALVTGSSSGIGAAIALELASEGVSVVVHGRDETRTAATAREIEAKGVGAFMVFGDLTRDAEADAVAAAASAAFGGIDILVNCAGGVLRKDNPPYEDVTPREWLASFDINVVSIIRLSQKLAPDMMSRGWGRIINISSMAGSYFHGLVHDYGSAKAAVDHLTGNLSKTLAPGGITVNAVIPGTVMTPQVEELIETLAQQKGWPDDPVANERTFTSEFAPQPIPRLGRPVEIAAAVAFLASPRADYITGATLRIDGGMATGR